MAKPLPSIEYLRQRLRYEPDTGKLFWLDYEGMPNSWRAKYAGTEAFTAKVKGYQAGRIDDVMFYAHRVAYALYHEVWPEDQLDHANGVPTDNRISNLRVVTNQVNMRNSKKRSDNSSGVTGVTWNSLRNKWAAQVHVDGKHIHLGLFEKLEDARQARAEASRLYGFTERHGT